mmetsp:Transcript_31468/g.82204  ORF Transcript_31468/g.82204 Transcript_31468/m.82204 type:complete len:181 (+) Transcript_31468:66-608(+)
MAWCSRSLVLLLLLQTAQSLLRTPSPSLAPRAAIGRSARVRAARLQLIGGGDEAPENAEGKKLITIASLQGESIDVLKYELDQRNKERFLEGKEQYASIEAMVDEYVEFEGEEKGMSRVECEDAVLRYLQRRALMTEGADGLTDPQTLLSLVLLGALLLGVAANFLGFDVPLPNNEPPRA